ncbi:MAG: CBS domain-containing protein, partial [Alphaproteobacteria bacterium]|nr:CBS domain-containing protein [Alphaproteobacteria bacterium]
MGLAPTTSTTMMLALGDALAVAVLELKGFTADDFRNFHPGGRLGDRLKRLSQVMLKESDMPLIRHTQSMSDALVEMTAKRLGCVGVVDDAGQLMGIITDGDIRRKMEPDLLQKNVSHVMTANPMTLSPRILAEEALQKLNASNRTQAFVVDDAGKPVGIIHIHELLRLGLG